MTDGGWDLRMYSRFVRMRLMRIAAWPLWTDGDREDQRADAQIGEMDDFYPWYVELPRWAMRFWRLRILFCWEVQMK